MNEHAMPLPLELPLEQLRRYHGTNPCPDDFARFWEDALIELEEVDPRPEWSASTFQVPFAQCSDLFYTGTLGARIHAKVLQPAASAAAQPAVLMFHGYAASSGEWVDKLPYVAGGFTVAAMDCRGQGGESEDPGRVSGWTLRGHVVRGLGDSPTALYYRHVFLDAVQLTRLVMGLPKVNAEQVALFGRSQGAGLALACAALEPRVRRVAALYPFLCDYKRAWELNLPSRAYAEVREYFRRFDPLHQCEDEIFTRLGYIDVQHHCPAVRAEILMAIGLADMECPPSTQFAAFNKIEGNKKLLLYPDFGHERLPACMDDVYRFITEGWKTGGDSRQPP